MTVAIHISGSDRIKHQHTILFKCFSKIASENSRDHFIFIFNSPPDAELYLEDNCTPVILPPLLTNNLMRLYWYNYKIPPVLEKYNVDIFIATGICCLRTRVKQLLIIDSKKTIAPQRKIQHAFIKKAAAVYITEPVIKKQIIKNVSTTYQHISLLNIIEADINEEAVKEHTRERLFNGNSFIAADIRNASLGEVTTILKAFSIFKKWQKSDMKIALAGDAHLSDDIQKQLRLYKYRTDVVYTYQEGDINPVISAAYLLIIVKEHLEFYDTAKKAVSEGVPVIISNNTSASEVLEDAPIYCEIDPVQLSEKIMLLYKNEHARSTLVSKGLAITDKYSLNNASRNLWDKINSIVSVETS